MEIVWGILGIGFGMAITVGVGVWWFVHTFKDWWG